MFALQAFDTVRQIYLLLLDNVVDFLLPLAVVWFPTLWSPLCEQFALPWCGESRREVESLHETHASWHFLSKCVCFLIKMLTERNMMTFFVLDARTNEGDYQWLWNVSMLITVSVQEDTKLPWVGDCLFWSCSLLWQKGWHSLFTRLVYIVYCSESSLVHSKMIPVAICNIKM